MSVYLYSYVFDSCRSVETTRCSSKFRQQHKFIERGIEIIVLCRGTKNVKLCSKMRRNEISHAKDSSPCAECEEHEITQFFFPHQQQLHVETNIFSTSS